MNVANNMSVLHFDSVLSNVTDKPHGDNGYTKKKKFSYDFLHRPFDLNGSGQCRFT